MKRRFLFLVVICLSLTNLAFATTREAVPFLTISPGARPAALGESYVALADDGFAPYWNPAGLGFLKGKHYISTMYSPWLSDIASDIHFAFFSYATYVKGWGTFGGYIPIMSYGTIPRTDATGQEIGTMSPYDIAINFLSYGTEFSNKVAVGINAKIIYSSLASQGSGAELGRGVGVTGAFDFGILAKDLGVQGLRFGSSLSNVGPNISYIDEEQSDPLPRLMRVGIAYQTPEFNHISSLVSGEYRKLLIDWREGDVVYYKDYPTVTKSFTDKALDESKESQFGGGIEVSYYELLALRAGYYMDREGSGGVSGESYIKGLTYGGGLQYTIDKIGLTLGIDFAVIPGGDLQPSGQKEFTLNMKWK